MSTDGSPSLPLQMALHFHLYFMPFAVVSQMGCLFLKYGHLNPTYQVVLLAVQLIFIAVEAIRPLLGYYGNLRGKIPALSGFWIISVIIQVPNSLFILLNPEAYPLPLERFIYLVHLLLMAVEIVCASRLINQLSKRQMARFKQGFMQDNNIQGAGGEEIKKGE